MVKEIITHSGAAHFDEVMAIGLLLTHLTNKEVQSLKITRKREIESWEFDDPEIYVIDVGERYDPDSNNFDHHNTSQSHIASFNIIARDVLGLDLEDLYNIESWWKIRSNIDIDASSEAKRLNLKLGELFKLVANPIEQKRLREFSNNPNAIIPELESLGRYALDTVQEVVEEYEAICREIRWVNTKKHLGGVVDANSARGMTLFRKKNGGNFQFTVSNDDSGEGFSLYRYEGCGINFGLIKDDPRVLFAHPVGFIAKTKEKLPDNELIDLIEKATF